MKRVRKGFDILISIEPLGCSTAAAFFVGFSMFETGALRHNSQLRPPGPTEAHIPRGGRLVGVVERRGEVIYSLSHQRCELIYRPMRYQGAGRP